MKFLLSKRMASTVAAFSASGPRYACAAPAGQFYDQGLTLYRAGRYSDATEAFEQAAKRHDHAKEAQDYIERIRKETVERIRNKALTGISKANWQSKYYFMNAVN